MVYIKKNLLKKNHTAELFYYKREVHQKAREKLLTGLDLLVPTVSSCFHFINIFLKYAHFHSSVNLCSRGLICNIA